MILYILTCRWDDEGINLVKAFSTEEKANQWIIKNPEEVSGCISLDVVCEELDPE